MHSCKRFWALQCIVCGLQLEEAAAEHLASCHDLTEEGQPQDCSGLQVLLQSKHHTGPTSIRQLTVRSRVRLPPVQKGLTDVVLDLVQVASQELKVHIGARKFMLWYHKIWMVRCNSNKCSSGSSTCYNSLPVIS